jgi:hypothetical protein
MEGGNSYGKMEVYMKYLKKKKNQNLFNFPLFSIVFQNAKNNKLKLKIYINLFLVLKNHIKLV